MILILIRKGNKITFMMLLCDFLSANLNCYN
jgi:hypothetical protein